MLAEVKMIILILNSINGEYIQFYKNYQSDRKLKKLSLSTPLGEGQVYTIGNIGHHKVVSTKLSRNGYEQGAVTSAGNTVTRMLGMLMNEVE